MGVKCSLLGHDYGETDVERERAEQGDEVVRTAKRVERCRNCNHTRTVSENTEVTALEAAAGVVREPDGTIVAATDELNESEDLRTARRSRGPRERAQSAREQTSADEQSESDSECDPRRSGEPSDGVSTEGGGSLSERSASDGGLIIENLHESGALSGSSDDTGPADESGAGGIDEVRTVRPDSRTNRPNRAPGEWPAEPDEPTRAPKTRDESAGLGSSGSLTVARTGTNRWPDETDATAETRTEPLKLRNATGNGPEASDASTQTKKPSTVFACPSCRFSASIPDSPLRVGDICPDCHHGYLARETRKG